MAKGILIFGANGSGKSTVGRALGRVLHMRHLDAEDYFFEQAEIPYSKPRDKATAIQHLLTDMQRQGNFVFSAVTGDYGAEISRMYTYAVWLQVPPAVGMTRIKTRALKQHGGRVLIGGDMYAAEQAFFAFVQGRDPAVIADWAKMLVCPVMRLDATVDIATTVSIIAKEYARICK